MGLDVDEGITLGAAGLPAGIAFTYADKAPLIRAGDGLLKFLNTKYYFDNNLQVSGILQATDYKAGNGSLGLTKIYSVKGSNNQNCNLTFTDGLLTASTCPVVSAPKR
jgi:hypothetical protein